MEKNIITKKLSLEKVVGGYVLHVGNDTFPFDEYFDKDNGSYFDDFDVAMYCVLVDLRSYSDGFDDYSEGEKLDILIYLRHELARMNGYELQHYENCKGKDFVFDDVCNKLTWLAIAYQALTAEDKINLHNYLGIKIAMEGDIEIGDFIRCNMWIGSESINSAYIKTEKTDAKKIGETVEKSKGHKM